MAQTSAIRHALRVNMPERDQPRTYEKNTNGKDLHMHVDRRFVTRALASGAVASALPSAVWADDTVVELSWEDLVPGGNSGVLMTSLFETGIVEHGQLSTGFEQPQAHSVTDAYNGKTVRLPGYIVPLDFDATGLTVFILAPYVGACIHVPPPPANQLVLVTAEVPYEYDGLFEPVYVTGMFGTAALGTELAMIGYALSADRIEPYQF